MEVYAAIETRGLEGVSRIIDILMSTAKVELVVVQKKCKGEIVIIIKGAVDDIRAAGNAAMEAAGQENLFVRTRMIPGPQQDLNGPLPLRARFDEIVSS